jgi:hypothetical protein
MNTGSVNSSDVRRLATFSNANRTPQVTESVINAINGE